MLKTGDHFITFQRPPGCTRFIQFHFSASFSKTRFIITRFQWFSKLNAYIHLNISTKKNLLLYRNLLSLGSPITCWHTHVWRLDRMKHLLPSKSSLKGCNHMNLIKCCWSSIPNKQNNMYKEKLPHHGAFIFTKQFNVRKNGYSCCQELIGTRVLK